MINRFRGTLDTWDPAFLDALASRYNVITIDYSGTGLSTGTCAADVLSMAKDVKDVAEAINLTKVILDWMVSRWTGCANRNASFPSLTVNMSIEIVLKLFPVGLTPNR